MHHGQVVGFVGQTLAQSGVVGDRLDEHGLLEQLAQVGRDGCVLGANFAVRHAVSHAFVDRKNQVGMGVARQ